MGAPLLPGSNPITVEADSAPVPMVNPSAFYKALIGGVETPGIIPPGGITGWDLVFSWDVKKGKGLNDATITDKGDEPPKGKIKYQVWRYGIGDDPNDFDDDDAFVSMLINAKENKQALDMTHPMINQMRVEAVVPSNIGILMDEGPGLWTRTIEFLKWVPQPTPAQGGTPSGANAKDPNNPDANPQENTDDPNKDLRQEFATKLDQAAND